MTVDNTQWRALTSDEINVLKANGCDSADWTTVFVADTFYPANYRNVSFSGEIRLGCTGKQHSCADGTPCRSGIFNATIHNCHVGSGVHISHIGDRIANCDIADDAIIRNVDAITCRRGSKFGNGTVVEVLSETGGHEVAMHTGMSAQEAFLAVLYRNDTDRRIRCLDKAECWAGHHRSIIGRGAMITNCGILNSLNIGNNARIDGAVSLTDGTVGNDSYIGCGVIARDFITCRNSAADTGARLDHVFLGEGSRIANGFNAHHSLIFSNCQLENGESAALFAGPCTVSMHKSTLLIGVMTSFFNAGSGSNQSNHLYKLGPCHFGILSRGVKLGSGSYIMWPANIGAFSLVMGSHKSHPDTRCLPFSYVVEENGRSVVIPAAMLRSVGLLRDAIKWPKRDRRPSHPLDAVSFSPFNPVTSDEMHRAIRILKELQQSGEPDLIPVCDEDIDCRCYIHRRHISLAIQLYSIYLQYYYWRTLLRHLRDAGKGVDYDKNDTAEDWIDAAGAVLPMEFDAIEPVCFRLGEATSSAEAHWCAFHLNNYFGYTVSEVTTSDEDAILDELAPILYEIERLLRADAEKEINSPLLWPENRGKAGLQSSFNSLITALNEL